MLHSSRTGLALLLLVVLMVVVDLWIDLRAGYGSWHVGLELAGSAALGFGILLLTHRLRVAHRRELELEARIRDAWEEAKHESAAGSGEPAARPDLRSLMDAHFSEWSLTTAEREVAELMLEGLRHKEIAQVRSTSERTARQQALAVYRKAGVDGRTELAGFFLARLHPSL